MYDAESLVIYVYCKCLLSLSGFLFTHTTVSFDKYNFSKLMKYNLQYFLLRLVLFVSCLSNICKTQGYKYVHLEFIIFQNFIVLAFKFKLKIYLKLFLYMM